jgi:hypothetical protein
MSGVVAGLIASVKAGSAPAPTNIITNGSFTVNANGWDLSENGFRDTSIFRSSPASFGNYGSEDYASNSSYTQNNSLTVGERYSLAFWVRNTGSQEFRITLRLGTGYYGTDSATLQASTSWQYVKFENQLCTGNTNLYFSTYGSNGFSYNIDDVSLVLGPTAAP